MNTPSPPPFQSFHSPYGSSFGIHTPDTGSSFDGFSIRSGSSRYSDDTLLRTHSVLPKIETREPSLFDDAGSFNSRPSILRSQTTPVAMSFTPNKDYLHFKFRKEGAKWDDQIAVEEIPAPELQIKKLAESKNKQGTAIQQLRKMGANRRARIDDQTKLLNAEEKDGSTWEPVYISSTKMTTRPRENIMEVKEFEIVFARKQPPMFQRFGGDAPSQLPKATAEAPKEDKAKKEKRKSKDRKAEKLPPRGDLTDDPFGTTNWFDPASGAAMGNYGPAATNAPGLPPFIPPEKPIGTFNVIPRIVQVDADILGNPLYDAAGAGAGAEATGADEILDNLQFPNDDDVIPIPEVDPHRQPTQQESRDRGRKHKGQSKSRSRSISRSRPQRPSFRQHSDSPHLRVHFKDSRFDQPGSSGSSVISGDTNGLYDEVDEMSSHTSEETFGYSPEPRQHRYVRTAARQHKPGPVSSSSPRRYELVTDVAETTTGKGRRRNPARETPRGLEQPQSLAKRSISPRLKPIITQPEPPQIPSTIPPTAEYPDFYEERNPEKLVDNYIRDSIRDRELRDRERNLEQRERAMRDQQEQQDRQSKTAELREELGKLRLGRDFGTSRQTVYNHEPRNRQ